MKFIFKHEKLKLLNSLFSIFSLISCKIFKYLSHMLGIPKETVRRKVDALCKTKQLGYSAQGGVTVGDKFEIMAKEMGPIDLLSIGKAIKAIEKNGGVSKILKDIK